MIIRFRTEHSKFQNDFPRPFTDAQTSPTAIRNFPTNKKIDRRRKKTVSRSKKQEAPNTICPNHFRSSSLVSMREHTLALDFRVVLLRGLVRPGFGVGQLCQPGGLKSGHFRCIDYSAVLGEGRWHERGGLRRGGVTLLSNEVIVSGVLLLIVHWARLIVHWRGNWNCRSNNYLFDDSDK